MNAAKILILALLTTTFACGQHDPKGDGWKLGDDTGTDAGTDDGGGSDGGISDGGTDAGTTPSTVTFRLTNGDSLPVFAYGAVAGGPSCGGGAWLEVLEDGSSRRISSDCGRCSCDDAPNCNVCAYDCAPGANPDYAQLDTHQSRTFEWDGLLRVDDSAPDGTQCESKRPPQSDTLTARFCWGYAFEPTFESFGEVADIECADVEFSPSDSVVEYTIGTKTREPMQFEMTNTTSETLYARTSPNSICDFGSWLALERNGDPLQIVGQCGDCRCADVGDPNMCPQPCPGVACAPPSKETFELPPGGQRSFTWNRTALFDDTVSGMACQWSRLITGPVTAQFCWGTDVDDNFALVNETCVSAEFDPFTDTVVSHEIQ